MDTVPHVSFEAAHTPIRAELLAAFERFLDKRWYILGEEVQHFEAEYAAFSQMPHCVGVSNGLDALRLCLEVLGIGPGDEVLVPSNAYIASVVAVSQVGAKPIFVEPHPRTFNIDPTRIAAAITPSTKAIMPVHLHGQPCEMDRLMEIANAHQLYVIEDNAQAHGATYAGQPTGSFGHLNATSFYPTKNLGALGDAGAITTHRAEWAADVRLLRNYGSSKKYYNERVGYNMRLDECQAALLRVKLPHLVRWNEARIHLADCYAHHLTGIEEVTLPYVAPQAGSVFHSYVICIPQRDALQQYLLEQGIHTLIHYPVPPHLQPAYAHLGYTAGDFPIAEHIANTCLSLPMFPGLTEAQVVRVAHAIRQFFK